MKNILLVGEYHSSNLGDNILCHCMEVILAKYLPNDCRFFWLDLTYGDRLTIDKKIVSRVLYYFHFLLTNSLEKRIISWYIKKCVEMAFKNIKKKVPIDLVIFAGGQIFMDYFAPQIYQVVVMAQKYGIPVVFNACGYGRNTEYTKALFIKALSQDNVKYLTLRDGIQEIEKLTSKLIVQIPDWAILCSDVYQVRKTHKDIVGLGVIAPAVYNQNNNSYVSEYDFLMFWKHIICLLDAQNQKWQLFVNGSLGDYAFAKRLINYLGLQESCDTIALRPKSGEDLISLIASYKSIISFRLHSHIISYSLGIPTVGIIWDRKLIEFAKLIHCEDRFFYLEDFDDAKFLSMLNTNPENLYTFELRVSQIGLIQETISYYASLLTKN